MLYLDPNITILNLVTAHMEDLMELHTEDLSEDTVLLTGDLMEDPMEDIVLTEVL